MKKILKFLLKSIVNHPSKLKISAEKEDGLTIFKISVAKEDIGKVIGKDGRTIKALTSLTRIKAIKEGKKTLLKVEEEIS